MMDEEMAIPERLSAFCRRLMRGARYRIGKHLPPRMAAESTLYGGEKVPVCPRCGELVYYSKSCIVCGQRFRKDSVTVGEVIDRAAAEL